jgi:hypothetical protein
MAENLAGETYPGTALVADVAASCDLPRDGSALIATPAGYVLLAPLPGDRWLTFIGDLDADEVESLTSDASMTAVAASMARRIPSSLIELTDVGWAAAFRMHKRMTPHLQGRARPGLPDTFALERGDAARHVLAVSDQLHELAHAAVEVARASRTARTRKTAPSPEQTAALVRARCMLDVSYIDSPLTAGGQLRSTPAEPVPCPGKRYPGRSALRGTSHHLLLSGPRRAGTGRAEQVGWNGDGWRRFAMGRERGRSRPSRRLPRVARRVGRRSRRGRGRCPSWLVPHPALTGRISSAATPRRKCRAPVRCTGRR